MHCAHCGFENEADARLGRHLPERARLTFFGEEAASKEQTVRGYKVKVRYKTVSEAEKKTRKQAIAEAILKALRRLKLEE